MRIYNYWTEERAKEFLSLLYTIPNDELGKRFGIKDTWIARKKYELKQKYPHLPTAKAPSSCYKNLKPLGKFIIDHYNRDMDAKQIGAKFGKERQYIVNRAYVLKKLGYDIADTKHRFKVGDVKDSIVNSKVAGKLLITKQRTETGWKVIKTRTLVPKTSPEERDRRQAVKAQKAEAKKLALLAAKEARAIQVVTEREKRARIKAEASKQTIIKPKKQREMLAARKPKDDHRFNPSQFVIMNKQREAEKLANGWKWVRDGKTTRLMSPEKHAA